MGGGQTWICRGIEKILQKMMVRDDRKLQKRVVRDHRKGVIDSSSSKQEMNLE